MEAINPSDNIVKEDVSTSQHSDRTDNNTDNNRTDNNNTSNNRTDSNNTDNNNTDNSRTDRAFMLNNSLNVAALTGTELAPSLAGGWSRQNTDTVAQWKRDLELMAFVYTTCKEKFITNVQRVLVLTLIVGAIATTISAINVALGGSFIGAGADYRTTILALNVVILAATGVTTVANGLIKIYSWDVVSGQYGDFTGRVGALWTTIDSELSMPAEQRAPAADFMKRVYGQYIMIKQLAPGIGSADVNSAHRQYQNAAYDNYVWENQFAQKFRQRAEELV